MLGRRALAALLACLAVLAGALNAVSATQGATAAGRSTIGAPCPDCDDCDKGPCSMPVADCIQMHANPGPALPAAPIELGAGAYAAVHWPSVDRTLSGLSPLPDPSPPRA